MVTKMPVIHFLPYEVEHKSTGEEKTEDSFEMKNIDARDRASMRKRRTTVKKEDAPA
jgi:hypothetical protein